MRNTVFRHWVIISCLILLLPVTFHGCQPQTPDAPEVETEVVEPEPATEPVPTESPTPAAPEAGEKGAIDTDYRLVEGQHYFEGFVILTGGASDIGEVVGEIDKDLGNPDDPELVLREEVLLDYADLEQFHLPFSEASYSSELAIRLYHIPASWSTTTTQIIGEVYGRADDAGVIVYADPDYVTGYPPVKGNPWSIGGAPWSIGGAPWSIGGAPGMTVTVRTVSQAFWSQWAFGEEGIRLVHGGETPSRAVESTGQGTRVAVFDTSPFTQTGMVLVDWMMPSDLTLTVSHPLSVTIAVSGSAPDVRDHGLFVAGLVHAVAPDSEIHLVRVLNEYAVGDLFTLIKALHVFTQQSQTLENTVINLSLGIRNDEADLPEGAVGLIRGWMAASGYQRDSSTVPVVSLEVPLQIVQGLGAVVVAAAGNDSGDGVVESALIPAAYPDVIGVAASNTDRDRSCFSNTGDVSAPGGDGRAGEDSNCVPRLGECRGYLEGCIGCTLGDCPYGVISLVRKSPSNTGYAYWAGTSFAAPQASGLAALLLEPGVLSPSRVSDIITGEAIDDVVDVPDSLQALP